MYSSSSCCSLPLPTFCEVVVCRNTILAFSSASRTSPQPFLFTSSLAKPSVMQRRIRSLLARMLVRIGEHLR